ncbi:type II toxin-antitoxin system RelE/ParE family toxin [Luteolibacter sp. GHJ8]|uniref:Type II toxin-antitoxin system RelE/ParE family toxin n=1 Tax=Luteolibacter rhizosphaerae TaxID=2989719 RepID=A0ABT3G8E4_9BACT|nr:type II toxin-antitoxin system RelE/ParE family toxin [Luteolibacter rhizosphaerae]MCW1916121.1 type II toxin-antitoxin system RelE/ParE family toxin [Luteolibacter rhizosphaerae]
MARVIWTDPALSDLDGIADYISLDDPSAAKRLVRRVFARVDQLESFPELGACPQELRGTVYRHLVLPPLRIFYRVSGDLVFILYIMRTERLFRFEDLEGRESAK